MGEENGKRKHGQGDGGPALKKSKVLGLSYHFVMAHTLAAVVLRRGQPANRFFYRVEMEASGLRRTIRARWRTR